MDYFMEDPREFRRLEDKVDADQWLDEYFENLIGDHMRVLDVGCGSSALVREMARRYPDLQATGVDISGSRIHQARLRHDRPDNLELATGHALDLPFDDSHFDLVCSRFLFEYVKDKERALSEMVRVCKPGGRIMAQDLDGQLVWHDPEDSKLIDGIGGALATLGTTGFDPFVGRKLYHYFFCAGLDHIQVGIAPYHLYAGAIDDKNYTLWETKLDIAMAALERRQTLESSRLLNLKQRFLGYLKREDTLSFSMVFTVSGQKRGVA